MTNVYIYIIFFTNKCDIGLMHFIYVCHLLMYCHGLVVFVFSNSSSKSTPPTEKLVRQHINVAYMFTGQSYGSIQQPRSY